MMLIEKPLKSDEVALMFGVSIDTVGRWVTEGRLPKSSFFKTPGGHVRFHKEEIEKLTKQEED